MTNDEKRKRMLELVDKYLKPGSIIYFLIAYDISVLLLIFALWLVANIFTTVSFLLVFFLYIAFTRVKKYIKASKIKNEDIDKIKEFIRNILQ